MQRRVLGAVMVLLTAAPAFGQVLYGTVSGTAVDASGQALPGVTVTLSGPAMQGLRTTASDGAGKFRFVPVPPGEGYTLVLELAGFATVESTGLNVNIGEDTAIHAEMPAAEFAETLTVTADGLVVDTTRSTTSYALEAELQDTLPDYRNFRVALNIAPGVRGANNPYVNGSSNDANLYLVDGVDTTDPRTQTWGTAINVDTIAEAQVVTAGFTAEYGRATGGILNLVTKSGGNAFSGTARLLKADAAWSARNGVDDETGGEKIGFGRVDEDRPVLTLGGPLVKDALWFHLAYEGLDRSWDFSWYRTAQDRIEGVLSSGRGQLSGHYFSGKLTWQLHPGHSLVGFYNDDPVSWGPLGRNNIDEYNESTDWLQVENSRFYSLQWTGVPSPSLLLEAKLQGVRLELDVLPDSPAWNQAPFIRDLALDYYYGGPKHRYRSDRFRDGLLATGSYYLDAGRGSHQIKAGVELFAIKPQTGAVYNELGYYRVRDGAPYFFDQWTEQSGPTRKDQDYAAVFLQDQWRLGRLTVNAGLRAEQVETFNNVGTSLVKFSFADMLAPRLGLAYDLGGDVVRASLGRFYQMPSNYVSDYFQVTTDIFSRYLWNGSCEVDERDVWTYDSSCWNQLASYPWGATAELDPDLKPGYVDELTLGFEKRLSEGLAGGITFIWREQDTAIDWYDPEWSGYYLITNVPQYARQDYPDAGLPNKVAEYQAVTLDLRKRLGPDGLQLFANYTYAWKDNGWQSYFGAPWRTVGAFVFTSPESMNRLWYGRSSSPHLLKIVGSYTFPSRTVVGIGAWWSSGGVYTPVSYAESTSGTPIPLAERGSLEVGSNWEADLYLEQGITIGPVALALYVNILDVFNNQQPTVRGDNADIPSSFMHPTGWQVPRNLQVGFKIEY